MGNTSGKHDSAKYVEALLKIFYNLDSLSSYDKIILDFDDTLWSRSSELIDISIENIKLLNQFKDLAMIISGNSYNSIKAKLSRIYGTDLEDFCIDVWAESNSVLFNNNQPVKYAEDLLIDTKYIPDIVEFLANLGVTDIEINDNDHPAFIKIKPLSELERTLLIALIDEKFSTYNIKAVKAGYTTVDIIGSANTKGKLYTEILPDYKNLHTLYLGDEIDGGNDEDISKLCSHSIHVSSVKDTNIILKLLLG
jgi:hydroxymethylpyrimidine pyrophosphatase-like HAD family hydrolase